MRSTRPKISKELDGKSFFLFYCKSSIPFENPSIFYQNFTHYFCKPYFIETCANFASDTFMWVILFWLEVCQKDKKHLRTPAVQKEGTPKPCFHAACVNSIVMSCVSFESLFSQL